jgi:hypothetical protein
MLAFDAALRQPEGLQLYVVVIHCITEAHVSRMVVGAAWRPTGQGRQFSLIGSSTITDA